MSAETELDRAALEYHEFPTSGKIEIHPTKPLSNQRDLALAYTRGVAAACNAILADPMAAARLTIARLLLLLEETGAYEKVQQISISRVRLN